MKQKFAFKSEFLSNLVLNLEFYFRALERKEKNNTKDNSFMVVSKVHN